MRHRLHPWLGQPHVGWLWPLALLLLPNCSFSAPPPPLDNPLPHTTLVFCDIEKPLERHCATDVELAVGVRLNAAAVALVAGQSGGNIGLDDSPAARARCGGEPEAVTFRGTFPTGNPLCVNGFAIGPKYDPPDPNLLNPLFANPDEACVYQCESFIGQFDANGTWVADRPADPSVHALCQQVAHASANVSTSPTPGVPGGCTPAGMQQPDFPDPRRSADAVIWQDRIGVSATANTLTRTATTGLPANDPPFDAGAASPQVIARGDAYVEFSAAETNMSHVCGLSQLLGPDADPSLVDVGFGIKLDSDHRYYVFEANTKITGPGVNGSFGAYSVGERFRVTVTDNADGTAAITYSRIVGPCVPGMPCSETVFHGSTRNPATYPFRVDASLRDEGATLTDVRIVRIH